MKVSIILGANINLVENSFVLIVCNMTYIIMKFHTFELLTQNKVRGVSSLDQTWNIGNHLCIYVYRDLDGMMV